MKLSKKQIEKFEKLAQECIKLEIKWRNEAMASCESYKKHKRVCENCIRVHFVLFNQDMDKLIENNFANTKEIKVFSDYMQANQHRWKKQTEKHLKQTETKEETKKLDEIDELFSQYYDDSEES